MDFYTITSGACFNSSDYIWLRPVTSKVCPDGTSILRCGWATRTVARAFLKVGDTSHLSAPLRVLLSTLSSKLEDSLLRPPLSLSVSLCVPRRPRLSLAPSLSVSVSLLSLPLLLFYSPLLSNVSHYRCLSVSTISLLCLYLSLPLLSLFFSLQSSPLLTTF